MYLVFCICICMCTQSTCMPRYKKVLSYPAVSSAYCTVLCGKVSVNLNGSLSLPFSNENDFVQFVYIIYVLLCITWNVFDFVTTLSCFSFRFCFIFVRILILSGRWSHLLHMAVHHNITDTHTRNTHFTFVIWLFYESVDREHDTV